jgi:hypothetical protein
MNASLTDEGFTLPLGPNLRVGMKFFVSWFVFYFDFCIGVFFWSTKCIECNRYLEVGVELIMSVKRTHNSKKFGQW